MARYAVDIDDTLWAIVEDTDPRPEGVGAMCACGMPVKQEPDKLLIELVHALITNGDNVFLWSAGGVEYVKGWIRRFAPAWEGLVEVIPKEKGHDIDISIDDQVVDLAKVNLRVTRPHADHWQHEDTDIRGNTSLH